jgi:hypothetical protein
MLKPLYIHITIQHISTCGIILNFCKILKINELFKVFFSTVMNQNNIVGNKFFTGTLAAQGRLMIALSFVFITLNTNSNSIKMKSFNFVAIGM